MALLGTLCVVNSNLHINEITIAKGITTAMVLHWILVFAVNGLIPLFHRFDFHFLYGIANLSLIPFNIAVYLCVSIGYIVHYKIH